MVCNCNGNRHKYGSCNGPDRGNVTYIVIPGEQWQEKANKEIPFAIEEVLETNDFEIIKPDELND